MKKIYFNVTTSYNWGGAPVGIVRTEKRILDSLISNQELEIELFIVKRGLFLSISLDEYRKKLNVGESKGKSKSNKKIKKNANSQTERWIFPILTKKAAIKNFVQASLSLTPGPIRPVLNRFLIWISNFSKKEFSLPIGNSILWKMINPRLRSSKEILFKNGDIVLSCGLDWKIYNFFENLKQQKKKSSLKIISFCYDIIPVNFPQFCCSNTSQIFSEYFIKLIESSDLVICISNSTRLELERFSFKNKVKLPSTEVIYLGSDNKEENNCTEEFEFIPNIDLKSPFIIYVSTLDRRKNHELLYKAYIKAIEDGRGDSLPNLYFVGMKGGGVDDLFRDLVLDLRIKEKIKILGRVTDLQLNRLYDKCKFVVFPSLFEGWGLGVGEAFAHGKFVLCSNKGALPEVGSVFAEYLDPYNPALWGERILFYNVNEEALKEKEKFIRENWSPSLWKQTAQELTKIINSL